MPLAGPLITPPEDALERQSRTSTRAHVFVFLAVWAISIGYMAIHFKRGWVPHDEGTLGLSAERVLQGQMPHRDFDDYTGGLTYLHAFAFRVLGISSASMRIVLFTFFVAWVPTVYYVASRFASRYVAAAITLLAIAWSVPNYPGPMPSWYNLFFATAGVAALLRYIEIGSGRWLLLAGMCGGLSILAKVTGAYFIAGACLFFVFREQCMARQKNDLLSVRSRIYSASLVFALAVFLAVLFSVIHKVPGFSGLFYFVLPACGLVALLLIRELNGIPGRHKERFFGLFRMCIPFAVGISIPLIGFLTPYLISGSVHDLIHGLVAVPVRAIGFATFAPYHPVATLAAIPFIVPVLIAYECGTLGRVIWGSVLAVLACVVLVFSAKARLIYAVGWVPLQTAIPGLLLVGLVLLWMMRGQHTLKPARPQQIMLLLCVTALCSLVQFPFAAPVYFLYVAPLAILCATAIFSSTPHPPRFALGTLIAFYLIFAVVSVTPYRLGLRSDPTSQVKRLTIPRAGGLSVEPADERVYDELIPLIQTHAKGGSIYAAPDCPEVYFLSGQPSPTRHYFEYAEDPVGRSEQTLEKIESLKVNVVAINESPRFSGRMSMELQSKLEDRFPYFTNLGKFQVRWKE